MTRESDTETERDAADWHAQVLAGTADWAAFACWLDAEPQNQPAYDRLAMLDAEVADWTNAHGMPEADAASDKQPPGMTRRWWLGGALAASLTGLVIGLPQLLSTQSGLPTIYATGQEQKTIALAGNGNVRLDRNSQIAKGPDGALRMDRGAAYFDVHHDDARPLEIRAGEFVVTDIGTRFTVTRASGRLFVAVEQGLVDISWRDGRPVRLTAGQTYQGDEGDGSAELGSIEPTSVGSWRDGRLVYDNTPLPTVAADLARYMDGPVEVDPAIANLRLSGILLIRNGTDLVDQISAILPIQAERRDGHVRLVGRPRR